MTRIYEMTGSRSFSVISSPDHAIYVIDIAMDDAHDLVGYVWHGVILHQPQRPIGAPGLARKNCQPLTYAITIQADHHHRSLFHPLGPLMSFAQVERGKIEDRRFFVDGAAVRDRRARG